MQNQNFSSNQNLPLHSWEQSTLKFKLEAVTSRLAKYELIIKPFTSSSVDRVLLMDKDQIRIVESSVDIMLQVLFSEEIEIIPTEGGHPERSLIRKALEVLGLEVDENIWAKIGSEDVIEIYDKNNIQVFRTFNFFKTSSYSLLDLLTFEWFHLWERSEKILKAMYDHVVKMSTPGAGIVNIEIQRHLIKEIFVDKFTNENVRKSVILDFNVGVALYFKNTQIIGGYLVSSKATEVSRNSTILFV